MIIGSRMKIEIINGKGYILVQKINYTPRKNNTDRFSFLDAVKDYIVIKEEKTYESSTDLHMIVKGWNIDVLVNINEVSNLRNVV